MARAVVLQVSVALAALVVLATAASAQVAPPPPRLFPAFVGSWQLDEAASTGRLNITPRIPLTFTIETTPTELRVTKRPRLGRGDRASATPPPEVYRLDGTETREVDPRTGVELRRTYRFTLVADMFALTIREESEGRFTVVTDAYSVAGDVLTLHRQLSGVLPDGSIPTMGDPANNFSHVFVYRRVP